MAANWFRNQVLKDLNFRCRLSAGLAEMISVWISVDFFWAFKIWLNSNKNRQKYLYIVHLIVRF